MLSLLSVLPAAAVDIELSDFGISVDGEPISAKKGIVYLQNKEGLPVVTITGEGKYRFSGKISEGQIFVDAGKTDVIELILDNAEISCETAPALIIKKAADSDDPNNAKVTLRLADGSANLLRGANSPKDPNDPESKKYDGAISSRKSLRITGKGKLILESKKEGIECKHHLTIDDGDIEIRSADDGINAKEELISVITVNGGNLLIFADRGAEGDAIDSNFEGFINGGTLALYSDPASLDRGLDADNGFSVNGGKIISMGNYQDNIDTDGTQKVLLISFTDPQDHFILNGEPYEFPYSYLFYTLSDPEQQWEPVDIEADTAFTYEIR